MTARALIAQFGQQKSRSISVPAPVGGWNTRDPRDSMPAEDAVELENWFPSQGYVQTRRGYIEHVNTSSQRVEMLAEFVDGATPKLVAAYGGQIVNVTSSTPSVLRSGYTNDRWQWAQFDDASGGARLGLVNGTNAPAVYDGSTVTDMTISGSGLSVNRLIGIHIFKNRSFFWEANTQDFWYSAAEALGGALTKFPLGRVAGFGGNLVAMGTLTVDGGSGIDDFAAFLMSTGDVLVYQGTDPGSDWALQGIFRVGAPLGNRAIAKFGGDLLVMTRDGYISLARHFGIERGFASSISDKISTTVNENATNYANNFGWQVVLYPKGQYLLFNVPVSETVFQQHIYNTVTGAWALFTGQNAICWATFRDDLYFGGVGGVYKADSGLNDDTAAISSSAQQAWTYLGDRANNKRFTAVRPLVAVNIGTNFDIGIGIDFTDPSTSTRTVSLPDDIRVTATADTRVDASANTRIVVDDNPSTFINNRYSVINEGRTVSVKLTSDLTNAVVRWFNTSYTWETGSIS